MRLSRTLIAIFWTFLYTSINDEQKNTVSENPTKTVNNLKKFLNMMSKLIG